jgi:DNA-3-methyladenine glycosylase
MSGKVLMLLQKLARDFYNRDTQIVAKELLGKYLVHIVDNIERIGKIVEVEAYLGSHDLAAHSSKGLTPRTKVMFGPPGFAYVYMIYGMYYCLNVVTEEEGVAAAVLLRALEPVKNVLGKTTGPGLLSNAMQVTKKHNGVDLLSENLYIAAAVENSNFSIMKRPRIGVAYAKHWARRLLRFYIKNNAYVSRK